MLIIFREVVLVANLALIHNTLNHFSMLLYQNLKSKQGIKDKLFKKIFNLANFFKNLLDNFDDFNILSIDSSNILICYLKTFSDNNFVEVFTINKEISTLTYIVNKLIIGLDNSLPKSDDEKWSLYVKLFDFCLISMLYENIEVQPLFMRLLESMLNIKQIPQVRYKEINNLIFKFASIFVTIKQKYKGYWVDVFKILDILIKNNEKILDSAEDMVKIIWVTFIKKLLMSFVDFNKTAKMYNETEYKPIIQDIFKMINEKGKFI